MLNKNQLNRDVSVNLCIKITRIGEKIDPGIFTGQTRFSATRFCLVTRNCLVHLIKKVMSTRNPQRRDSLRGREDNHSLTLAKIKMKTVETQI